MLIVSALSKQFGTAQVLKSIDFNVTKGALVAILGASGSGKTTVLRVLAGFLQPDAGQIRLDDKIIATPERSLRPEQRGIGYVAQEGALFPHLNVAQNISFGLPRAERKRTEQVEQLLALVGLPVHYATRPPQALSGGEQQRVALARALAPNPRLLLLDEPFSALDAGLRAETRAAVMAALRAANATAILVTHDQDEALSMGQMVGVMQQGRLAQWAEPATLYRYPVSPEVAAFVGKAVFLPGRAQALQAVCAMGPVTLLEPAPADSVLLMIRPEQIKISPIAISGSIKAIVTSIAYYGHDAAVSLRLCADESVCLVARVAGYESPAVGDVVKLTVSGAVMAYPAK